MSFGKYGCRRNKNKNPKRNWQQPIHVFGSDRYAMQWKTYQEDQNLEECLRKSGGHLEEVIPKK